MTNTTVEEVLAFWFAPPAATADERFQQIARWFRGGPGFADEIRARFADLPERGLRGELDAWTATPRGRLALVLVLDQLPRNLHRGTPRAYACDAAAQAVALAGLERDWLARLATPPERLFAVLPLGHAEDLRLQVRALDALEELIARSEDWRPQLLLAHGHALATVSSQARFGRQPERNAALGRASTAAEERYLAFVEASAQRA